MRLSLLLLLGLFHGRALVAQNQCPLPYAQFTHTFGPDGFTVLFESAMGSAECGGEFTFLWYFDDGTTSTEPNPVHVYAESGTYRVRLTVTLKPPCTGSVTTEHLVTVQGGNPGTLWVDLKGPNLLAECQQVFYDAHVVGGTPPYTYEWNMGDYYCGQGGSTGGTPCCATPGSGATFTAPASINAKFASTGFFTTAISVKVTDARGKPETAYLNNIRVKAGIQPLGIIIKTVENCQDAYKTNTPIIMRPDIKPLSAFEYPTNYLWEFGDGTTYLDNMDAGGVAVHTYTECGPKTIKLTVSDPYGSMQTTQQIFIGNMDCVCPTSSGGGSSPVPRFAVNTYNWNSPTVMMDYDPATVSVPSVASIQVFNPGSPCSPPGAAYYYRWTWAFPEAAPNNQPFVVLDTRPSNPSQHILFKDCLPPNDYLPFDHAYYRTQTEVNLTQQGCGVLTQNQKYWGCLSAEATIYTDAAMTVQCATTANPCVVYVKPDEFILNDIEVTGSCRDYILTAKPEGGGWRKVNGQNTYQEYIWEASSWRTGELLDVLEAVPGRPDQRRVKLDHPFFKQFGPSQFVEFMVKLSVTDYANQKVEQNELVAFNPFRLHLKPAYTRCPSAQSKFSDQPLASGGSGSIYARDASAYTFVWNNGLSGHDPTFTAPGLNAAPATYRVTVSDGPCVLTATAVVTSVPLLLDMLPAGPLTSCNTNASLTLGPAPPHNLGGSGSYTFEWTPGSYLDDPTAANPSVVNIAQSTLYTLKVTDQYGGCSRTDQIQVNSANNNLNVEINGAAEICHRAESFLFAHVPGNNPPGNRFKWSSTNKYFKPPTATNAVQISLGAVVNSVPGPHTYTVRYSDPATGCYKDASKTVTVRPAWDVYGYEPEVRTATVGSEVDLWGTNGTYTHYNSVTGGFVPPLTYTWLPQSPISVEYHASGIGQGQPKNGKFKPTFEAPYLTLKVTDAAGCSKDFKTIRYVLCDSKPNFYIDLDPGTVFCEGKPICFDVYMDAHISDKNLNLSWLPTEVSAPYTLRSRSFPSPPSITGSLSMPLANTAGLYVAGRQCRSFGVPSVAYPSHQLDISLAAPHRPFFGTLQGSIPIHISRGDPARYGNRSTCVVNAGGGPGIVATYLSLLLGKTPCPDGTEMRDGGILAARDFIEISPDADIILVPSSSANGGGAGPHLLIDPCLKPPVTLLEKTPRDTVAEAVAETGAEDRSTPQTGQPLILEPSPVGIDLALRPNPFTGEIRVDYSLGGDKPVRATLRLLGVAGEALRTLFSEQNHAPGRHQFVLDGANLPAGVYWFELTTQDGLKTLKKAVKTTY